MTPYFFNEGDKQLFGVYHDPVGLAAGNDAVLLLYPTGQEYMRAHRAFQYLASDLSKQGLHVLRFDYFGTGDSAGGSDEASVRQWLQDVRIASEELFSVSGAETLSVVGLRFGATLAMLGDIATNQLILWDPVVNGNTYLHQLSRMHQAMLRDLDRFRAVRSADPAAAGIDLIGYPFPGSLRSDLEEIDLLTDCPAKAKHTSLFVSEQTEDYTALAARLEQRSNRFDFKLVNGAGAWSDPKHIESALLPFDISKEIIRTLTKKAA